MDSTARNFTDRRVHELDGLRGVAAVTVMYAHIFYIYGTKDEWAAAARQGHGLEQVFGFLLARTPLGAFFSGAEAVILFFILSGFVLSLPFLAGKAPGYGDFAIRRFLRIYPPYLAALLLALCARNLVTVATVPGATSWVSAFWQPAVTARDIAGYVLMTGFRAHTQIDFVVWSLIHELRISAIFPLLFAVTARSRTSLTLLAFFVFSYACAWLSVGFALANPLADQSLRALFQTGSFVWYFVVGIELARHRHAITAWIAARRGSVFAALFALAACFYAARLVFPALGFPPIADFIVGIGAAGLVALTFGRESLRRVLSCAPVLFFGEISYSLYLLHPIVLLTVLYGLHGVLSPIAILIVIGPASVLVAWVGNRLIERPAIRLGRMLTARKPRLPAVASLRSDGSIWSPRQTSP